MDGLRWLTVLDSRLPRDDRTEVEALLDDLSLDDQGDDQRRRHGLILSHDHAHFHSGVIDIAWDDVCNLFGTVCVSWDPLMFKNQLFYHG